MVFYGNGIVRLPNKQKIKFIKTGKDVYDIGKIEIDDSKLCALMIELGYPCDGEMPSEMVVDEDDEELEDDRES